MISDERKHEYRRIKHSVFAWSRNQLDIKGIAVVGSWARREAQMNSHLDLLVLTLDMKRYITSNSWICHALPSSGVIVGSQTLGSLTELQVRLPSGLIIDFGFVPPSWFSINPIDPAAAQLVRDGCLPVADPESMIERFIESVSTGVW